MILVIIGHVQQNPEFTPLKRWLHVFHMPAYFIISGMFLNFDKWKERKTEDYLIDRAKILLIPYLMFETIGGLYRLILFGKDGFNLSDAILNVLTINCNVTADWFLPTLFIAEIMYVSLRKLFPGARNYIFAMSFTALFFNPASHPMIVVNRCIVAYMFIEIGQRLRKQFMRECGSTFKILMMLIFTMIVFSLNGKTEIYGCTYGNPLLYLLGAIIGTMMTIDISRRIRSNKLLTWIGRNSIIIMGTHQFVIVFIHNFLGIKLYTPWRQCLAFVCIVTFEILLFASIEFSKKVKKTFNC